MPTKSMIRWSPLISKADCILTDPVQHRVYGNGRAADELQNLINAIDKITDQRVNVCLLSNLISTSGIPK